MKATRAAPASHPPRRRPSAPAVFGPVPPPRFRCTGCGSRDVRAERQAAPGGSWWPGPTPPLWVLACQGCGHSARGLRCGCGGAIERASYGATFDHARCTRCGLLHESSWD